ncbi:MAG TPA: bifunctional riboflavin kinase/FAD synthetase [Microbacterium sp.]|nr:bifunctional riboflavin kinase/FAD synthetase [Microbacterium sp.]
MMLFRTSEEVPDDFGPSVVTIGKFDGVHEGHRAIIQKMLADSASRGARSVVVTFDRHPLALLDPARCPPSLAEPRQKAALLAETGIDATLMLTFDEQLAAEEAADFVRRVLVDALQAREVLVGQDFRFGRGGAGDAALLRTLGERYGFTVGEIPDVRDGESGRRVSSTWIRELLVDGDVAAASKLLGRPPSVRGEVVHGAQRGRELGYPTANLEDVTDGLVPADGVYAGWLIDGLAESQTGIRVRRPAAISVGDNPTFDDVPRRQVEAYVLDETDLDLYGHIVEVQFVARLRGISAFDGIEALTVQMARDVERAREILVAGPMPPLRPTDAARRDQ